MVSYIFPLIKFSRSFCHKPDRQTVSKAFAKSIKAQKKFSFASSIMKARCVSIKLVSTGTENNFVVESISDLNFIQFRISI